ncbi:RHS repeat-associated core domain-containing protein [Cysteiniphilum litorale]|uniref:RHS repeat-associated core domain-containing protein n=1 Tax=Cysteiniphilum litorale TaxID=2056700 RepID=UPI003F881A7E
MNFKLSKAAAMRALLGVVLFNTSFANCQFSYDINGDLLIDSQCNHYQYNDAGQLIGYFNAQSKVQYHYNYNADSLRDGKSFNQTRIGFTYGGGKQIMNSIEAEKNIASAYLQHQVRYIQQNTQETAQYIAQSKHNQTDLILNNKIDITKQYNYTPYGQVLLLSKSQIINSDPLFDNPLSYDGEYKDAESGLVYLRARFYNPELMHFVQRDDYQLSNRYNFSGDNPINMIDPTGHYSISDFGRDLFSGFNITKAFKNPGTFFTGLGSMIVGAGLMSVTGGASALVSSSLFNTIGYTIGAGAFSVGLNMDVLAGRGMSIYKGNNIIKEYAQKQLLVAGVVGAATGLAGFAFSGAASKISSAAARGTANFISQWGLGVASSVAYAKGVGKYVYGVETPNSQLYQNMYAGLFIGFFAGLSVGYANYKAGPVDEDVDDAIVDGGDQAAMPAVEPANAVANPEEHIVQLEEERPPEQQLVDQPIMPRASSENSEVGYRMSMHTSAASSLQVVVGILGDDNA